MKFVVRLLVVLTLAAGFFYAYKTMLWPELTKQALGAKSLSLSEANYADGEARAQAAREKITESLSSSKEAADVSLGQSVFLRVFKEDRELELWLESSNGFRLFKTYPIAAMSGQLGPKLAEGDRQAPEGFYFVTPAQMNPSSRFHLAFNIGYPNAYDRSLGRTGSYIMVHGSDVSTGCFAMTDEKIEEIYTYCDAAFNKGQPYFRIHVFPFRMSAARMSLAQDNANEAFWQNLKEGYDWFERENRPPNVSIEGGKYRFSPDKKVVE